MPRKRSLDDVGDSAVEVSGACGPSAGPSSASRSPPKRVRIASTASDDAPAYVREEDGEDDDQMDEDEDDDGRARRESSSDSDDAVMASARIKAKAVDDEDDDDDDDEENEMDEEEADRLEDARMARQRGDPLESGRAKADGALGMIGIIEEVTLRDFMCHKFFTIKLEPYINFICGGNGSGKSAVLTGILVGLGQKAAATGRANGLRDFIRKPEHGEALVDRAEIMIKLKNQGDNPWKPKVRRARQRRGEAR